MQISAPDLFHPLGSGRLGHNFVPVSTSVITSFLTPLSASSPSLALGHRERRNNFKFVVVVDRFYIALFILRSRADSLGSHVILRE